jgi:hypothetical protein
VKRSAKLVRNTNAPKSHWLKKIDSQQQWAEEIEKCTVCLPFDESSFGLVGSLYSTFHDLRYHTGPKVLEVDPLMEGKLLSVGG